MAQKDKTVWLPMSTAPKDRDIVIRAKGVGVVAVYYVDCEWLRESDPETTDCWRTCSERSLARDIELDDATGWRPGK